ncbi:MAG TPA: hypothetical protein DD727_07395 [Clostridiales bacterium]|nr:hypothetical protein [Clostridiales bacterium]
MSKKGIRFVCIVITVCVISSFMASCIKKKPDTSATLLRTSTSSRLATASAKVSAVIGKTTQNSQTESGLEEKVDETEGLPVNETEPEKNNGETSDEGIGRYAYDFGGRTIYMESAYQNIGYMLDYDDPIAVGDRYDANTGIYRKGFDAYRDLRYDHWREVEQKLNCKIRVKFSGDWNSTPIRMKEEILAGTYTFSLVFPNALLASWVKYGLVTPLNDYVDFDSLEKLRGPLVKAMSSWGDKYYTVNESVPTANLHAIQYNPAIQEREGLPDLVSVYQAGQWTWDKLLEVARLATRDYNGDGIMDLFGAAYTRADWVANNFLQSNGVPMVEIRDGRYISNMDSPAFVRALTFISDMMNIYKVTTTQANYTNGKAYMFLGGQFNYHTTLFYNQSKIKSKSVPTPLGPDNTEGKLVVSMKKYGWYIPSSEKDPKGISYLLVNLMWTDSDPEKPVLSYEQRLEDLKNTWNSSFWPGADIDLADEIDFFLNKMTSSDLISATKMDIVGNGFVNLETTISNQLMNKLNSFTPISQIIDSSKPIIESILNEYN